MHVHICIHMIIRMHMYIYIHTYTGECASWRECRHREQKNTLVYQYPYWSGPEAYTKNKERTGVGEQTVTWHPVVLSLDLNARDMSSVSIQAQILESALWCASVYKMF
jgi:hypothetical protein